MEFISVVHLLLSWDLPLRAVCFLGGIFLEKTIFFFSFASGYQLEIASGLVCVFVRVCVRARQLLALGPYLVQTHGPVHEQRFLLSLKWE